MINERRFDQTAEGWDAASDEYARLFAPFTAEYAKDIVRLHPPGADDDVLDIASGSGMLAFELAQRARSVLATDLSPRMIARIESAARPNVRAAVMDAQSLDAADAEFAGAYCMFGAMFFPDRAAALREIARVLKPNGRCVLATWAGNSRLLAPIAAAVEKVMPGSPAAQALSAPAVLGTAGELRQELEAAGLRDVAVYEVSHILELPSREIYVRDFPGANPTGIMMRKMLPPPVFAALSAQIDAELAAEFGEGPVRLEGIANIAGARRE